MSAALCGSAALREAQLVLSSQVATAKQAQDKAERVAEEHAREHARDHAREGRWWCPSPFEPGERGKPPSRRREGECSFLPNNATFIDINHAHSKQA